MFFLSKLLFILIYLVGLTSLFIVLWGRIVHRAPAFAKSCYFFALALLFLGSNRWVRPSKITRRLYLPRLVPPTADAIAILGAALEAALSRANVHLLGGDRLLYGPTLYCSHRARLVRVGDGMIAWRELAASEGESGSKLMGSAAFSNF
jgi:hypothetical protein